MRLHGPLSAGVTSWEKKNSTDAKPSTSILELVLRMHPYDRAAA